MPQQTANGTPPPLRIVALPLTDESGPRITYRNKLIQWFWCQHHAIHQVREPVIIPAPGKKDLAIQVVIFEQCIECGRVLLDERRNL